jgi:peptide/nickel transport system permease protein
LRTGVLLLGSLLLFSIVGQVMLVNPNVQNLLNALAPPSSQHLLGADPLGRDILSWIASGIWTAVELSFSVAMISSIVGTLVGLTAGYLGGVVDSVLMRVVDLQLAVPPILIFIGAAAIVTIKLGSLILLLCAVGWVPYARLARTKVLAERERSYVAAARLAGSGRSRVVLVHLLPAVSTSVLILGSLQAGYVLLWETGLSFLGLGLQPPTTSLGFMIAQGQQYLQEAWWIVLFPGLAVVLLLLSFNLIGDGMRDVFHLEVEVLGRK